jgi:hypothetical protein
MKKFCFILLGFVLISCKLLVAQVNLQQSYLSLIKVSSSEDDAPYSYLVGHSVTVRSINETTGEITIQIPPELVGDTAYYETFQFEIRGNKRILASVNGAGSCFGAWDQADCSVHWSTPLGSLPAAKAYIAEKYADHAESIEGLNKVAEHFNRSPNFYYASINLKQ